MPGRLAFAVTPGPLSPADKERITALAETGARATRIARTIGKHPSTVQWFMTRTGLHAPRQRDGTVAYRRGGRTVRLFSRDEDALIEELRVTGLGFAAIAARVTAHFGWNRNAHSVQCRLVALAAREEA